MAYRSADELGLPDPDMAATGDGRMITAAINELTVQMARIADALDGEP